MDYGTDAAPWRDRVVFVRDEAGARALDPKRGLTRNARTNVGRMNPRWYIPVRTPGR